MARRRRRTVLLVCDVPSPPLPHTSAVRNDGLAERLKNCSPCFLPPTPHTIHLCLTFPFFRAAYLRLGRNSGQCCCVALLPSATKTDASLCVRRLQTVASPGIVVVAGPRCSGLQQRAKHEIANADFFFFFFSLLNQNSCHLLFRNYIFQTQLSKNVTATNQCDPPTRLKQRRLDWIFSMSLSPGRLNMACYLSARRGEYSRRPLLHRDLPAPSSPSFFWPLGLTVHSHLDLHYAFLPKFTRHIDNRTCRESLSFSPSLPLRPPRRCLSPFFEVLEVSSPLLSPRLLFRLPSDPSLPLLISLKE